MIFNIFIFVSYASFYKFHFTRCYAAGRVQPVLESFEQRLYRCNTDNIFVLEIISRCHNLEKFLLLYVLNCYCVMDYDRHKIAMKIKGCKISWGNYGNSGNKRGSMTVVRGAMEKVSL